VGTAVTAALVVTLKSLRRTPAEARLASDSAQAQGVLVGA
jgi:hypothetical protein